MVRKNTLCGAVKSAMVVVALVSAAGSWAADESKEETRITLDAASRAFVQNEMNQYVNGIGQALNALATDDQGAFATALRPLGMSGMSAAPMTLMQQLPMGFKQRGMRTHGAFDRLAAQAEQGATTRELLSGLSEAMTHCGGCHGAYRISGR